MGRNLPATRTAAAPAVRVIYYPEPAMTPPVLYTPQQLAAQREERVLLYLQWRTRYAAIQDRDRRTRRILTRIALGVAVLILAAVTFGVWLVYQLLADLQFANLGDVAIGLFAVIAVLFGGIGCGCVTIVRHYH